MKLTKHTRFRQEENYILLCRVDTLQYFQIENKWLGLLLSLKEGKPIDISSQTEEFDLFLKDLKIMGVLEDG